MRQHQTMSFGKWVDAHGHLADSRWLDQQDKIIKAAQIKGLGFFMQGGFGPEDWYKQKELIKRHPDQIGLCFGLHPYWVVDHDEEQCEAALDLLASELPQALGLGELGLDFRPHIMRDSQDRQLSVFEQQLELAQMAHKPVVLHLVQAHEAAIRVMDLFGLPTQKGMVHSFNGSWGKAQDFLKRGLFLSIGGPVCRSNNKSLQLAVQKIPLEYLLLESDCPDQAPPAYQNQLNPPESIWEVAKVIGMLKSLDPVEILDITTGNFHRLFGGL